MSKHIKESGIFDDLFYYPSRLAHKGAVHLLSLMMLVRLLNLAGLAKTVYDSNLGKSLKTTFKDYWKKPTPETRSAFLFTINPLQEDHRPLRDMANMASQLAVMHALKGALQGLARAQWVYLAISLMIFSKIRHCTDLIKELQKTREKYQGLWDFIKNILAVVHHETAGVKPVVITSTLKKSNSDLLQALPQSSTANNYLNMAGQVLPQVLGNQSFIKTINGAFNDPGLDARLPTEPTLSGGSAQTAVDSVEPTTQMNKFT